MRRLENFARLYVCAHLRMGNVVDCRPRVDRVLILSAFRLLHVCISVNSIPSGRLKPLCPFTCPFVCLLPIVTISFANRRGFFLFMAAMNVSLRRREGLQMTAERSAENCPLHPVNPSNLGF